MRRALRLVISLAIAIAAAWMLRGRLQNSTPHPEARLDRGVAGGGDRVRIDPHGRAEDRPMSPFNIEARIEGENAGEYEVEVQLSSSVAFDSVYVQAARFDHADEPEAAWSGDIWSGGIEPNVDTRFEARVPRGATTPVRLQIRAQAIGTGGARHTATAILRPDAEPR
jgi:hypothetical protein